MDIYGVIFILLFIVSYLLGIVTGFRAGEYYGLSYFNQFLKESVTEAEKVSLQNKFKVWHIDQIKKAKRG